MSIATDNTFRILPTTRDRDLKQHRRVIEQSSVIPLPARLTDCIPSEIYDAIIDHLHNADIRTLATCGLVCRAWVPASRYHLFRDVFLCLRNVNRFLELVDAPGSTLVSSYIHSLTLVQRWEDKNTGAGLWFHKGIPLLDGLSIKVLRLEGLRFVRRDQHPEINGLESNFQSITDLELRGATFNSFAQFAATLSKLRNLQRVYLDKAPWSWSRGLEARMEHRPPCRLQTLDFKSLSSNYLEIILGWLIRERPIPPIQTMNLCDITQQCFPAFGKFSSTLGPLLKHISLSAYDNRNLNHDLFSCNTNLQSIRLNEIYLKKHYYEVSARWVSILLAQITSPLLETIVLGITLEKVEDLEVLDWESLAETFERPQFSNLRKIQFNVSGWKRKVGSLVRSKLPGPASRGIIRVYQPVPGFSRADRM